MSIYIHSFVNMIWRSKNLPTCWKIVPEVSWQPVLTIDNVQIHTNKLLLLWSFIAEAMNWYGRIPNVRMSSSSRVDRTFASDSWKQLANTRTARDCMTRGHTRVWMLWTSPRSCWPANVLV